MSDRDSAYHVNPQELKGYELFRRHSRSTGWTELLGMLVFERTCSVTVELFLLSETIADSHTHCF
jgi:hypothetical protein